jgi:radical SAM protein (TIGR01212 family)
MIQSYTEDYDVWVEYGLQSAHNETLRLINRGHSVQDFTDAVEMTANRNIQQCAHIILGLPGESREHVRQTAKFLSELQLQGVKLHPLQVIVNTKLAEMYARQEFEALDRSTYIEWLVDVLELLPPEVVIQRLTADAPRELLIAPDWCRNKLAVLRAIDRELLERDTWQGEHYTEQLLT